MSVCPVCEKDAPNLRKHASGKSHNNPDDYEHLRLALSLSPGALAYLRDNLEELHREAGRDADGGVAVVGGHGGDEGADVDTGRGPSPALARLLERGRAAEAVAGEATDIEVAADSGGQPEHEAGDTAGIDDILDRILARDRAREAKSKSESGSDYIRRLREALDGI